MLSSRKNDLEISKREHRSRLVGNNGKVLTACVQNLKET